MHTDPQSTAPPSHAAAGDPESHAPRDPRELFPMTAPTTTVSQRVDAEVDAAFVRVLQDGAVKYNTFPSRPGYPSGMASLRTHLHVETWVRNTTFAKNVWADVHVYTHDGNLAHSETLPLRYTRPAGDGDDVFTLDSALYQGVTATPGSVDLRPDARLIEYRVYCQIDGRTFTDGTLHACYLKPDVVSR
jgi:hypothetical protein